jgi:hypothetical protein
LTPAGTPELDQVFALRDHSYLGVLAGVRQVGLIDIRRAKPLAVSANHITHFHGERGNAGDSRALGAYYESQPEQSGQYKNEHSHQFPRND